MLKRQSAHNWDVEELEDMMQVYADTTGNLLQEARTLEEEVKDTEELVSLQLDTQRNKILGVEMVITIFSAFFGLGAFVVGVFGMNFQWSGGMFTEAPRGKAGFGVTVAATGEKDGHFDTVYADEVSVKTAIRARSVYATNDAGNILVWLGPMMKVTV